MRNSLRIASGVIAVLASAVAALADVPAGPPKPGPEHAKLSRFLGKWTGKGDLKPGPFGPGGQMTWTETCEWFAGNFSVVCKSEGKGPTGEMKGMGIIGYDAEEKTYTYYGVDNTGYAGFSRGTLVGKTWTFAGDEKVGGKSFKSRFTIEETSPSAQRFKWEMSEDGKTWSAMMEGESTK